MTTHAERQRVRRLNAKRRNTVAARAKEIAGESDSAALDAATAEAILGTIPGAKAISAKAFCDLVFELQRMNDADGSVYGGDYWMRTPEESIREAGRNIGALPAEVDQLLRYPQVVRRILELVR